MADIFSQFDPYESLTDLFMESKHKAKRPRLAEESVPSSGLNMSKLLEVINTEQLLIPLC